MAFVVLYDACVLYPAPLRDLLIRADLAGMVQGRWSKQILDECFHNLLKNRPDLQMVSLIRTRQLMEASLPHAMVDGFEVLESGILLPDANDRHVVAAAVHCGAQTIVTWNRKDFPVDVLSALNVETRDPDEFLLGLLDLAPGAVLQILQKQVAALRNPPQSIDQLLETLQEIGLVQFVARFRELMTNPPFSGF